MSIIRKLQTFFKLGHCYFASYFGTKRSVFMSAEETAKFVLDNKINLIRFGDGEFNLMQGYSISYQNYSDELRNYLLEIVTKYVSNQKCNYLLCMPGEFLKPSVTKLTFKQLKSWLFSRVYFNKTLDFDIKYGDAFLFAKQNYMIYKKIWESKMVKRVIFVHNNIVFKNNFENKFKKPTLFIQNKSSNCFDDVDTIIENIKSIYENSDIVLLSCGPAAKVIAFECAKNNIWCIDTGHCWDDPLNILRRR